jgi:hypothetical protein
MSGNSGRCTFFGYLILIEWSLYQGSLVWVWGSELLTLGCIQISQVTSHNQQTLFSRHSVPLLGHSIYVRLRQPAMLLLFIKILQLKNFFFKLLFFLVGCVLRLMNGTLLLWNNRTSLPERAGDQLAVWAFWSKYSTSHMPYKLPTNWRRRKGMLCPSELTLMLLPKSS